MATSTRHTKEREESAARRAGERRAQLFAVIAQAPRGLGIKALARATGIHDNTVRFHLERLIEEGLVERRAGQSSGPGRPPLTFVARRDHDDAGHDNYELIARVLTDFVDTSTPDPSSVAREAGRHWGRSHAAGRTSEAPDEANPDDQSPGWDSALNQLTRVLHDTGFAPELTTTHEGAAVRVHHCPFLSIARHDQTVPCGVHLGLMQGVLEATGAPVAVDRLEPFVTPTVCVAHFSRTVGG